jgi:hypothetical protein
MQDFQALLEKIREKRVGEIRGQTPKKWGLVMAKFAIKSPVPRSALFLK